MDCIPIILVQTAARGDRVSFDVEVLNFQVFFQLTNWNKKIFLNFSEQISLGAMGDSFYEYLLKVWIQSNKTDSVARRMYDDAMAAIVNNLIQTSRSGLIYTSDMRYNSLDHTMDHLACFSGKLSFTNWLRFLTYIFEFLHLSYLFWSGGLFALGAATKNTSNSARYMEIGEGITNTCHESYIRTATHLGPEKFGFVSIYEFQTFSNHLMIKVICLDQLLCWFEFPI